MVTGKEVHTQKIDFLRLFGKKVVLNVSRWAWRMRKRVIYRKKPIFLKLAQYICGGSPPLVPEKDTLSLMNLLEQCLAKTVQATP